MSTKLENKMPLCVIITILKQTCQLDEKSSVTFFFCFRSGLDGFDCTTVLSIWALISVHTFLLQRKIYPQMLSSNAYKQIMCHFTRNIMDTFLPVMFKFLCLIGIMRWLI